VWINGTLIDKILATKKIKGVEKKPFEENE